MAAGGSFAILLDLAERERDAMQRDCATIGPPAHLLLTEIMTAIKTACDSAPLKH
jgi:hypothetical protein